MSKSCRLLFLLLALLLVAALLPGEYLVQAAGSDEVDIHLVSQLGGSVWAVDVEGDYAYVGMGASLVILDVSDPSSPIAVGKLAGFPDFISDIDVYGTRAYLADYSGGLQVVDISTPESPVLLGAYQTMQPIYRVYVRDDCAYITERSVLHIIDIRNPSNLYWVGGWQSGSIISDIEFDGDYLYVVDGIEGLEIIDISNPSNPFVASNYDTEIITDSFSSVCLSGILAYVNCRGSGMLVIDVSEPTEPSLVSRQESSISSTRSTLIGSLIYWVDQESGLRALDITDPYSSIEDSTASVELEGTIRDVCISGGYAYVASWEAGLQILSMTGSSAPTKVADYQLLTNPQDVYLIGDYLYVAGDDHSLQIVDVSNPNAPTVVNTLDTAGTVMDVSVVGNNAYLAAYDAGLIIADVTDPAHPVLLAEYDTPGLAKRLCVSDTRAYIADASVYAGGTSQLLVIDVSDSRNPVELAHYDTAINTVCVKGNYAFIARSTSVVSIDISNLASINPVDSYNLPSGVQDLYIEDDYLYVANDYSGLRIIDAQDPENLIEIGANSIVTRSYSVCLQDNHAYVGCYEGGFTIVNVNDPTNPRIVGIYDTPGYTYGLAVSEEYVYLPADDAGLYILSCGGGSLAPTPTPTATHTPTPQVCIPLILRCVKDNGVVVVGGGV